MRAARLFKVYAKFGDTGALEPFNIVAGNLEHAKSIGIEAARSYLFQQRAQTSFEIISIEYLHDVFVDGGGK